MSWCCADWFDDCDDVRKHFPTCEHLLRDNWYVAAPIPQSINDDRPEQEHLDATYCNEVRATIVCLEVTPLLA